MKKILFSKLILLAVIISAFTACDDDEPQKIALYLPTADYSFEIFDMQVVFTDKSDNAATYYWTFGDGETSTEQNPTHVYAASKKYSVELTITSAEGKTSSKKATVDLSDGSGPDPSEEVNITIDGSFDDWADVPTGRLATSTLAEYATDRASIKEMKFCGDEDYLYFYFKVDNSVFNVLQLYIDKDNSTETGFLGWTWTEIGTEYLFEADKAVAFAPTVFTYDDANGNGGSEWAWIELYNPNVPGIITASELIPVEGNIVEFEGSISRELITGLGTTIKVAAVGVDGNWDETGLLPSKLEDGSLNEALKVKIPAN